MGRAGYEFTDVAKSDLRDILRHVREQSPQAAKGIRIRFYNEARRLAEFPYLGHKREDVAPETLRFWSVYSYLIVYRPDRKPIEIVRVLHGARDLPRFFRP